jgi:zinc transport system substrate-binding protein
LLLALMAGGGTPVPAAEIDVVASIKPVHSLVAGVMQDAGEPVLLVKGTGSEHSYSLRPSAARALEQAEVVFWVGEAMETFLVKPLRALAGNVKVIELRQTPGLTLLPTREGRMWEAHEHGVDHGGADDGHGVAEHVEGRSQTRPCRCRSWPRRDRHAHLARSGEGSARGRDRARARSRRPEQRCGLPGQSR